MSKLEINIVNTENGNRDLIETDGFILLYLKGDKIKTHGSIDLGALAPVLTKIALERLTQTQK